MAKWKKIDPKNDLRNVCYARGNMLSKIMFIGECPGSDEVNHHPIYKRDELADMDRAAIEVASVHAMPIPFCGVSGQLLHAMIQSKGGMSLLEGEYILENAYNRVCYDNEGKSRTPNEEELLEGKESLLEKIQRVKPKLIVTLGVGPLWTLCYAGKKDKDSVRMSDVNGVIHRVQVDNFCQLDKVYLLTNSVPESVVNCKAVIPILPLYHPAAILRDKDGSKGYKQAVQVALAKNRELIGDAAGRALL